MNEAASERVGKMISGRSRRFLVGSFASVAAISFAQTAPPQAPFDVMTWKATMKQSPATGVQMGALTVKFEKTTLADIRQAAARGVIAHQGDAGESVYWLCYTNSRVKPAERIWLMAHGEMGGPEHYVTDVSAELMSNGKPTKDCPTLPKNLTPVGLDNSLWIGASQGRATWKLGAPSFRNGSWRSYDFQTKLSGDCGDDGFDRSASLLLHFLNGHVNMLQAGQTTSC